jgi:phage shock protein PspC (stress-responsive transcriptional regulator)
MERSFSDRVFGGVCGGLAADLRLNAWLLRLVFIALTIISLGLFALVYLALWWALPQESLIRERRGGLARWLLALGLMAVMIGAWAGHQTGWLVGASGQALLWPVLLLVLSMVFLLRQVRG